MSRKPRRWDALFEDDPGAGLLNLFDVWIAFSVALLLALFGYLQSAHTPLEPQSDTGTALSALESLSKAVSVPRFRPTHSPMSGEGTRLGTAYRLKTGEVVYVPEADRGSDGFPRLH
ncbi:MAG: DUF2149 domain-containing protein [Lentisphaerota bacterium]